MANELQIAATFIPHLRSQFSRGAAVLFTGAGFSFDAISVSGEKLPCAAALSRALWEIRYPGIEFEPSTQLQDIYEAAVQTSREETKGLLNRLFTVEPRRCPPFYIEILSMPWTRIYTLNIDDLAEKVLDASPPQRPVVSISATTGNICELAARNLNIIHLNGSMQDIPQDVTFSRSQYARRPSIDAFYTQLRHDLVSRSVVFVGSSLEEGPLWQHLEMRGPLPRRDEREMRPRSYLVTPTLNRSKEALLSRFNIVWLQKTAQQFAVEILAQMEEEKRVGTLLLWRSRDADDGSTPQLLRLESLLPPATEATEYLLGAEPVWSDVQRRRIAHRDCYDELHDQVVAILAKPTVKQFLIVTGTAGTGKTSAMMTTALRLQATGVATAWVDAADRFDVRELRRILQDDASPDAIFIGNADLLERRLSRLVRDVLESRPSMLIVCECRSTKIDRMISREELDGIHPTEYTIPYLGDSDIDAILDVLDRENRLGALRGQSRERRRSIFRAEAGRQMLVAMYKATHGREFKEKVIEELGELEPPQRFLYGLVCVAHAHRFHLGRDELAIAFGDDIEQWPRALDYLTRRKLLLGGTEGGYSGRHREISQFVYSELTRLGSIADVIRGLVKIGGTKATVGTSRTSRGGKMLGTFINHALMKRTVGPTVGRQIYGEFEELLAWDYHYWLHRGALELESDNLGLAENFLHQAKGIEPNDVFVDNELAYLALRRAVNEPYSVESEQLVRDAIAGFDAIAERRPDQRARIYHVMGTQGLEWSKRARMSVAERAAFLGRLHRNVQSVLDDDTDGMLARLDVDLRREILGLAVDRES